MTYRRITSLLLVASTLVVAGCDGLKEAFTAHVDVAAHAGSQELSVTRLAELLGGSRLGVPVTRENAGIIADLWTNYQLMGTAAARGDSLNDQKTIDAATTGFVASVRVRKLMDSVARTWPRDTAYAAAYNQAGGNLFAARHILFRAQGMTPQQRDSVRRVAETVRPQVTAANFAQMAARHTTEPGGKERGGMLGVFPRGDMVKPFSDAVAAARPGEITPGLVETDFGYHIVQRLPYELVPKDEFAQRYTQSAQQRSESTYYAGLTERAKLEVKSDAPATLKRAAREPREHRKDRATLATFQDGGDLTVGRMLQWITSLPNPQRVLQQLESAPDSAVRGFVRDVARQELLLREADRGKVSYTAEERAQLTRDWGQLVAMVWQGLGVDPKSLADSAKSAPERERLAAARVEGMLDRIMSGQAQIVPIPMPLAIALEDKYDASVNRAGLDRATERAAKIRASADSARAAQQPRSDVPIPGAPGTPPGPVKPGEKGQNPPSGTP